MKTKQTNNKSTFSKFILATSIVGIIATVCTLGWFIYSACVLVNGINVVAVIFEMLLMLLLMIPSLALSVVWEVFMIISIINISKEKALNTKGVRAGLIVILAIVDVAFSIALSGFETNLQSYSMLLNTIGTAIAALGLLASVILGFILRNKCKK